jgi:rhodanese-related sulfurtransferase
MHGTRKIMRMFVLAGILLIAAALSSARGAETEFKVITTDQLKAMIDEKKDFLLIDARTKEEYQEAHIANALSVPENKFEETASLLPPDKNSLMVLYCNGVKCGKSKKAAKKADAMGYKNILIYGEGFPVWEEKGNKIVPGPDYAKKIETAKISPSNLKKLIDSGNKDFVIVDVRDETEYKEGHIPSAINIPAEKFCREV